MTESIIRLSSLLADVFLINYFFESWYKPSKYLSIWNLSALLIILLNFGRNIFGLNTLNIEINILITIVLYLLLAFKHYLSLKEAIIWSCILLAINFISELISFGLLNFFITTRYLNYERYEIQLLSTSIASILGIIFVLALKITKRINEQHTLPLKGTTIVALSSIPLISIVVMLSVLLEKVGVKINSDVLLLLLPIALIYMNICMVYLYSHIVHQLRSTHLITLEKRALLAEKKYISEIEKNQKEVQEVRHDLQNQFLILLGLLEEQNYSQVQKNLEKLSKSIQKPTTIYTPNLILNYLLNEKIKIAKENNIRFNHDIFISEKVQLNTDILAIVVGNLIDNALQACLRHKGDSKFISLALKQQRNQLFIQVQNSFDSKEVPIRKNRLKEGIGTRNIQTLVAQLGGLYSSEMDNDIYSTSIIIFNIY
ncbi:MAG: GHKL domain-containing protein [Streptococcaceae bacterium]|jgi:sensor histidine kinase YesM|nr:GHKL domain-containing protein [Streptococcaceae bacterium]